MFRNSESKLGEVLAFIEGTGRLMMENTAGFGV
jgi:hypothetical protein